MEGTVCCDERNVEEWFRVKNERCQGDEGVRTNEYVI